MDKDLTGASTSLLVLGVLARGPSYGYDILRQVNTLSGGLLTWQEGTLYPILHKLEKSKLLRSEWQYADAEKEGGRRRKYYFITPAGRAALRAEAKDFLAIADLVRSLLPGVSHA